MQFYITTKFAIVVAGADALCGFALISKTIKQLTSRAGHINTLKESVHRVRIYLPTRFIMLARFCQWTAPLFWQCRIFNFNLTCDSQLHQLTHGDD